MSEVRVNKISPRSGTTVTLGDNGDTITIPSGVTLANSGTFTNFQSTGIDDNATSTAITIDSSENVGIGTSSPTYPLTLYHSTAPYFALQNATTGTSATDGMLIGIGGAYAFIRNSENQPLVFQTNGNNERMRIDSSGSVGIGTTAPFNSTAGSFTISNTSPAIFLEDTDSSSWGVGRLIFSNGILSYLVGLRNGTGTSGSEERFRVDASGNVGIGTTTPTNALTVDGDINSNKLQLASNAGSHTRLLLITDTGNQGPNRNFIEFHNVSGNTAGRIEHNGVTTVSYITSSDYRLKENVDYTFDATTRLKQLKPARFNFIEEPNKTVDGFLAHEVSDIVPEAISGEKDEVQVWKEGEELPEGVSVGDNKLDENGNTIIQIQGIDQAKLVPLLVKTIQELEARITTLENA